MTLSERIFYERKLLSRLITALRDTPVVAILGPRQCGKTTLVRRLMPEYSYFNLDDEDTLAFAESDPKGFVATLPDRTIIDEVQRAPALLRAIKLSVDTNRFPGRFVLTGSTNLLFLPDLGDSLAGRMEVLDLAPLTQAEIAGASGSFLTKLLSGDLQSEAKKANQRGSDQPTLAQLVLTGGFPEAVARATVRARTWHRSYIRTLIERDVHDVARVRNVTTLNRMLELLALRTGELLNISGLSRELQLQRSTVDNYLSILERLYLVHRLLPWHRNPSLRLIKTPKIFISDSGVAATLADLDISEWNKQRERAGHMLETFVLQQLLAQSVWGESELRFWHYRDKDQVEVDIVLTRGRNVWGIEIKSALSVRAGDAVGLRRLADRCGNDYRGGIVLYGGEHTFSLDERNIALPIKTLWQI